jgi:hypothetical protein
LRATFGRALLVITIAAALACSDRESRRVAGDYCLDRRFQGDHYNLTSCYTFPKLRGTTDNGPMDGTITKLGWNRSYILAWRVAVDRSQPDGWMLLHLADDSLEPLISDVALSERRRQSADVASLAIHDVATAWRLLLHAD